MNADEPVPLPTLASKLNYLFATLHPADRGEWSNEEVARRIMERGGPTISATYIYYLRRGERDNPTKKHLEALADFFGVSPAYFFDDEVAERVQAQLGLIEELRSSPVRDLRLRAEGVSPGVLRAITEMLNQVRELEGLPPAGDDPPPPPRRRGRRSRE